MPDCKNIRDLILTDYMDGQLDLFSKEKMDHHLGQCPACQSFAKEAKENLTAPFAKTARQRVPEHLWPAIAQRIQDEEALKQSPMAFIKNWLAGLSFPKLVPAFGSLVMLVLLSSTFFLNQQVQQAQDQTQSSYLTDVLVLAWSTAQEGSNDPGTPIERYFL